MSPAELSSDRTGFRLPHTGPMPTISWHRMRPPGTAEAVVRVGLSCDLTDRLVSPSRSTLTHDMTLELIFTPRQCAAASNNDKKGVAFRGTNMPAGWH